MKNAGKSIFVRKTKKSSSNITFTVMKKTYIKPEITVHKTEFNQHILAGSEIQFYDDSIQLSDFDNNEVLL